MKTFGADCNIQPMPNPKPLKVVRCEAKVRNQAGEFEKQTTSVLVVNASVFPKELIYR